MNEQYADSNEKIAGMLAQRNVRDELSAHGFGQANALKEPPDFLRKEAAMQCSQADAPLWHSTAETLAQIARGPVWDGNLISKTHRDTLHKAGLIDRTMGWNFVTPKGVEYAVTLGILRA
jgi:hypothetical protein